MKVAFYFLIVVAFIVFSTSSVFAQNQSSENLSDNSTQVSFGDNKYSYLNGRGWKQLDVISKKSYLVGLREGSIFIIENLKAKSKISDLESATNLQQNISIPSKFKIADAVEQIDEIYKDSANIRLPVIEVYRYAVAKLGGAKDESLKDILPKLRQKYKN